MLWCNDFRIYIPLVTSCAKRAVPVRVPDRIVRVAASHTVIATVIEVAKAPPSTETRGGRSAVEAGLTADSTAACLNASGPLDVSTVGILDILPVPRGHKVFRQGQRQVFLLDIILGDGSAADLALVFANVAVKDEVIILQRSGPDAGASGR